MFRKAKHFLFKIIIIVFCVGLPLYIALWLFSFKQYPVEFGVSFSTEYASSMGLDWKETYKAILTDLKPNYIRIAAPWKDVEKQNNTYTFADVDFMMNEAEKAGAKVVMVVGQKVPRWPECFFPDWAKNISASERRPELLSYVEKTVSRYKNNKTLEYWQVENEPFINFTFGECGAYDRAAVKEEIALVRKLDPSRNIVVTDSGELSTWREASGAGDILGTTLYRVVRTPNNFLWQYGYAPAATYKVRAWLNGKLPNNFFIAELQAEPWFSGGGPQNTPISVQEETMSPTRLKRIIRYTKFTGASRAYFWGPEWWYFMKKVNGDSRYWDIGKEVFGVK